MDRTDPDIPEWLDVSRETIRHLSALVALVEKWNPAINLVSKASVPQIWQRHVLDSAQIFELSPPEAQHWLDLGSGAGFPGLVVAILARGAGMDWRITMVESDLRKATFLRQAARQLDLDVTIVAERIETLAVQDADVLSARALAPLAELCAFAALHLRKSGTALFPKGAQVESEIIEARQTWQFDLTRHQSRTNPAASILAVKDVVYV